MMLKGKGKDAKSSKLNQRMNEAMCRPLWKFEEMDKTTRDFLNASQTEVIKKLGYSSHHSVIISNESQLTFPTSLTMSGA